MRENIVRVESGEAKAYGSALNLPPVISVKKCVLVALLGSAKRERNFGATGLAWAVRVESGFWYACEGLVSHLQASSKILR